jgi:hypothetical protein
MQRRANLQPSHKSRHLVFSTLKNTRQTEFSRVLASASKHSNNGGPTSTVITQSWPPVGEVRVPKTAAADTGPASRHATTDGLTVHHTNLPANRRVDASARVAYSLTPRYYFPPTPESVYAVYVCRASRDCHSEGFVPLGVIMSRCAPPRTSGGYRKGPNRKIRPRVILFCGA